MRKDHRLEALIGIRRRQHCDDYERQVIHRATITVAIAAAVVKLAIDAMPPIRIHQNLGRRRLSALGYTAQGSSTGSTSTRSPTSSSRLGIRPLTWSGLETSTWSSSCSLDRPTSPRHCVTLSLPTSGDRPYCGAMVERRDVLSWLRDDDDDDDDDVLRVNTRRLTESDIWYDVILSRRRSWRYFTQKSAATRWVHMQRLPAHMQAVSASSWSWYIYLSAYSVRNALMDTIIV